MSDKSIVDFRRPLRTSKHAINVIEDGLVVAPMDATEFNRAWTAYVENDGPCPYLYQPALMEAAVDAHSLVAISGQPARCKNRPSEWKDEQLGPFIKGDKLMDGRLHHTKDVHRLVSESDIVNVDGYDYILGIFAINSSKTGNYGTIIREGKRLAFNGVDVSNLVGRINNGIVVEYFEYKGWIVWKPNQQVTWGTLNRNDSVLTYDEIREDSSNSTFVILENPIVGNDIDVDVLIEAVKVAMSDDSTLDKDDMTSWNRFCGRNSNTSGINKTRTNIKSLCRLHPKSVFCFGFRSVQIGIPCFTRFVGDSLENCKEVMNFVIGQRLPLDFSETKWDYRRRLKNTEMAT